MKIFKRLLMGLIIFLIVVSIAFIIYVLQFAEESRITVKLPKTQTRQTEVPQVAVPEAKKTGSEGKTSDQPKAATQKEKTVVSKIEKVPLSLRQAAIIIDDIGYDLGPVRELLKIDANITFAILPLCSHTQEAAEMIHKANRETLLHLPMEPTSYPREKPGNGALFTDMNNKELMFQLEKDLASVPHISGVNNHMGSKFMANEDKLVLIFEKLKEKNLFFIDSRTAADSKALAASEKVGLPLASRKVFLDNTRDYDQIYKNLLEIAQGTNNSPVIIIGHPYPETIRALKNAAAILREKGVSVVPVSRIIKAGHSTEAS